MNPIPDLSRETAAMSILRRLTLILLPLGISLAVTQTALGETESPPIIEKVREATEQFKNINVAKSEGWVQATPCVSGPDHGAMGVHFVMPSRINGNIPSADAPQASIYEPLASGAFRLVGVEFIVIASQWQTKHPNSGPPALEGNLMNFVNAPNRYGLPAFYEIHVWAWQDNPSGSFADWNTRVFCDKQPIG
jgi:hypothetical protein